jgi:hypothetical protein
MNAERGCFAVVADFGRHNLPSCSEIRAVAVGFGKAGGFGMLDRKVAERIVPVAKRAKKDYTGLRVRLDENMKVHLLPQAEFVAVRPCDSVAVAGVAVGQNQVDQKGYSKTL